MPPDPLPPIASFHCDGSVVDIPKAEDGPVLSFNGRTGNVAPQAGDYAVAQVTGAATAASVATAQAAADAAQTTADAAGAVAMAAGTAAGAAQTTADAAQTTADAAQTAAGAAQTTADAAQTAAGAAQTTADAAQTAAAAAQTTANAAIPAPLDDTKHQDLGGGSLHAVATALANGFFSAAMFQALTADRLLPVAWCHLSDPTGTAPVVSQNVGFDAPSHTGTGTTHMSGTWPAGDYLIGISYQTTNGILFEVIAKASQAFDILSRSPLLVQAPENAAFEADIVIYQVGKIFTP